MKSYRNYNHFSIILLTLFFLILSCAYCFADTDIIFHNEFAKLKSESRISGFTQDDIFYLNGEEFAEALGIKIYKENTKKKLVLYLDSGQLKLTAGSHFIVLDSKVFQLIAPVAVKDDVLYFPLSEFIDEFDDAFPGSFTFDGSVLTYGKGEFNITGITTSFENSKIIIDIRTAERLDFAADSAIVDGNFSISVINGKADPGKFNNSNVLQCIESMDCRNDSDACQLSFKLNEYASLEKVFNDGGGSIKIEISGFKSNDKLNHTLKSFREGLFFDTIVIDPGHGGKDPGARGRSGLKEKDVVLDIALRLEKLLRTRLGVKTVMTRDKDEFIPLYERGKIANQSGGKLFISIHANANKSSKPNGVETYFLSPARTDKAIQVAEMENASIQYETDQSRYKDLGAEDFILLNMTKSNDLKESELIAGFVQDGFGEKSGLNNRGVDQAGFYVLYGANMPSILVEVAFISNKREEKLLKSKKFRQDAAEIIFSGIAKFCEVKKQEK